MGAGPPLGGACIQIWPVASLPQAALPRPPASADCVYTPESPHTQTTNQCLPARTSPSCGAQAEPERLRAELEAFLGELGVAYSYSTTTKFANFRNRTLE